MKQQIEHQGTVERIMSHSIIVSIAQETACSACAAAQLCHSADKKDKHIEISCEEVSAYRVGQSVVVVGKLGLGLQATLWAYVFPLIVLMAVLLLVSMFTGSEGWGAAVALASLLPYYIILYKLRGRMQRKFSFNIKS